MPDRSRQTDVLLHYLDQQHQLDQLYAHGPISSQPVPKSTATYEPILEQTAERPVEQLGRRAARRRESADTPAATRVASSRAESRAESRVEASRADTRAASSGRRFGAAMVVTLLVALAVVVAVGVYVTRQLVTPEATLKTAGSAPLSDQPAAASSAPKTSAPAVGELTDLGDVRGVYTLAGPRTAAAGAWAVLTLSGEGKRVVRVDTTAPFQAAVDTGALPNGTYTLSVLVVNPGHDSSTSSRLLHVNNAVPSKSATKSPKASASGSVSGAGSPQAAQVVTLTNQERATAGCKPLTVNATLTTVAQAHSVDMAKNNYFDHNSKDGKTPFDRMSKAGYGYRMAAENIAMGQPTPAAVMDAWMNSAGHKANILNCGLKQIGIGYALNGNGTPYWTQDFGTPA